MLSQVFPFLHCNLLESLIEGHKLGHSMLQMIKVLKDDGCLPRVRHSKLEEVQPFIGRQLSRICTLSNRWKQRQVEIQLVESCHMGMGLYQLASPQEPAHTLLLQ